MVKISKRYGNNSVSIQVNGVLTTYNYDENLDISADEIEILKEAGYEVEVQ